MKKEKNKSPVWAGWCFPNRFWTQESTLLVVSVMSLEKVQSAIIPKLGKGELLFFAYLQSFLLIPLMVSELCSRHSSKFKNEQRAITTKFGKAQSKFLCIAHLPIEIYQPTKFHVDISYSFRVMSRTRCF
jgi:hypothetical protein